MKPLIAEIAGGGLRPGDHLPRELDLAQRFDVSRGVAREAIRGLEERGLITVKHGRGATVTPPEEWSLFDPDVLEGVLRSPSGPLEDVLESHRFIAIQGARLAAERAQRDDIVAIREELNRLERAAAHVKDHPTDGSSYTQAELAFSREMFIATHNYALGRISEPIHQALLAVWIGAATPERLDQRVGSHQRLHGAISKGDADGAALAIHDLLVGFEEEITTMRNRVVPISHAGTRRKSPRHRHMNSRRR